MWHASARDYETTRPSSREKTLRAARAMSVEHKCCVGVYCGGEYQFAVYVYSGAPRLRVGFGAKPEGADRRGQLAMFGGG